MEKIIKKDAPNKLRKIANYAFPWKAEMMASLLKKQGIPVLIQNESCGMYGSSAVPPPKGVSLLVSEKDFEKAMKILPE